MANVEIQDRRRRIAPRSGALRTAILNSAAISSIATDEKGLIQIFSPGAERMLGYTKAEVANKRTPAELSDPLEAAERARALSVEFATAIACGFEALVFKASRGIEDQHELTWIRKDGSRLATVVSVSALRDAQSQIVGYLLVATENTAQQAFRRMVQSVTACGIVQLDAQGQVLSWNAGAQIIEGYSAREIVGEHFSRFYSGLDADLGAPQRDLDAAAATGRCETEDWRVRKDGSMYRARIVLTPVRDHAGALCGFARLTWDLARGPSAPKQRTVEIPEPACRAHAPSGAPRRSLLYVEDHSASLAFVEQLVAQRTDVLLLRAASVDLGIELARSARPEVILLNIDLPGISALQFMKLLRADPSNQNTPLLALGANPARDAVTKALEAGFFQYLAKPLKAESFVQALDHALEFAALERAEQDQPSITSAHH